MTDNVTDTNVGKMTIEESIDVIDISPAYIGLERSNKGCSYDEWSEAVAMAIEALRKQIPMKPIIADGYSECPICHADLNITMNYCTGYSDKEFGCGQALDWRDEE